MILKLALPKIAPFSKPVENPVCYVFIRFMAIELLSLAEGAFWTPSLLHIMQVVIALVRAAITPRRVAPYAAIAASLQSALADTVFQRHA